MTEIVTYLLLFGVNGKLSMCPPVRSQVNIIVSPKQEHSWKPEEQYAMTEPCMPAPTWSRLTKRCVPPALPMPKSPSDLTGLDRSAG